MNDASTVLRTNFIGVTIFSLSLALASPSWADDSVSNFKLSGFLSAIGGKVLSNNLDANYSGPAAINGADCPCYVADWGNAGVYNQEASLKPESRAGIQVKYKLNQQVDFGAQLVIRGSDSTPNLQWAYANFKPNNNWEIQIGRKRIPLYFYSDFQDVGVAYPWISPPPELYGWEATNYNGGSLRYRGDVGDTNLSASFFAGKETVKNSLYQRLYYAGKTKVIWDNLRGGDVEISNGPFTGRVVFMQAKVSTVNIENDLNNRANLNAFGIAANFDFDSWFILTEFTKLSRKFTADHYKVQAPALTIGAGMRIGKWTPFLNFAQYIESTDDLNVYAPQSFRRESVTLRYDIDVSSAVKVQVDSQKDVTNNFGGHVTVLRIGYDRVF